MTILELQKALLKKGFDPGPLDGIAGPRTRLALRAFQAKNGLEVDGIAGPKTIAKLGGSSKAETTSAIEKAAVLGEISADMPWLSEAKRLIGTAETSGAGTTPAIAHMGDALGLHVSDDETPWCGLFVGHCLASSLPDEPMPANPLGARQWIKFGAEVAPQFGSTLVFWRGSKDGWTGHVGFYWAEDDLYYHVLGGNQSNAVNVSRQAKSRLLGARWPKSVPPRNLRRFAVGTQIQITENEA